MNAQSRLLRGEKESAKLMRSSNVRPVKKSTKSGAVRTSASNVAGLVPTKQKIVGNPSLT